LLFDDIGKGCLSHSAVGEDSWGDPAENPLKTQRFVDPLTGAPLRLDQTGPLAWHIGESAAEVDVLRPRLVAIRNVDKPHFLLRFRAVWQPHRR